MAKCPYFTKMIMVSMDYNGSCVDCSDSGDDDSWRLESGTPTNEVKWAECNEDGTVTLNGVTEDCELWDSVNNRCGTKVSDTIVDQSNNENDNLVTMLEAVLGKESNKEDAAVGATILTLWNHYHDSHNHQNPHKCVDLPSECGSAQKCMNPPYANDLIQEYSGNEDMDGNDKIYGFDFKIDDDDQDKPPMLKGIQKSVDWPDPSETITWQEYVDEREGKL